MAAAAVATAATSAPASATLPASAAGTSRGDFYGILIVLVSIVQQLPQRHEDLIHDAAYDFYGTRRREREQQRKKWIARTWHCRKWIGQ